MANPSRNLSSSAPTSTQTPSVGRIVHYHSAESDNLAPWAAIVAGVGEGGNITVHAFPPHTDSMRIKEVPFSDEPKAGCWSWPPRA